MKEILGAWILFGLVLIGAAVMGTALHLIVHMFYLGWSIVR